MRFLLINQFFAPDPAPTGQLLADVARALLRDGHSVTVVCSAGSYAAADGAGDDGLEQVRIHRLAGFSFGSGHLARVVSYLSFVVGSLRYAFFGQRPDVVLTLTTPPLLSVVGAVIKKVRGGRHVIWEMDVYPDVAVALGVFARGGVLDRIVGFWADASRRHSDAVIALGACMRRRLIARGISPAKIEIAENWADGSAVRPRPLVDSGPIVILYSGNFGRAHDIETIAAAMEAAPDPERFRFVFAGSGLRRAALEAGCLARGSTNTTFLPYQSSGELANHLGACHVGLVTQIPETTGAVVPSKTYALMAAGRPFLFIGPRDATPAELITRYRCGWQVDPGDPSSVIRLLSMLQKEPQLIHDAGRRAREAFLSHCDLRDSVARVVRIVSGAEPKSQMQSAS